METLILRQRTAQNGTVVIPIPEYLRDQDLEMVLVIQPTQPRQWRPGFFEETYGSLADDPLELLEPLLESKINTIE